MSIRFPGPIGGIVTGSLLPLADASPPPPDNPFEAAGATNLWAAEQLGDYTGPIARIRRDNDNAETDINSLTEIAAFVGVNTWKWVTIYDQIGSLNANTFGAFAFAGTAPNTGEAGTTINSKPAFSINSGGSAPVAMEIAYNANADNAWVLCLDSTAGYNRGILGKKSNNNYYSAGSDSEVQSTTGSSSSSGLSKAHPCIQLLQYSTTFLEGTNKFRAYANYQSSPTIRTADDPFATGAAANWVIFSGTDTYNYRGFQGSVAAIALCAGTVDGFALEAEFRNYYGVY